MSLAVLVLLGLLEVRSCLQSPEPLFAPRLRQRERAPDGRHELFVWTRTAWWPKGGADPRIVLFLEVRQPEAFDGPLVVDRREVLLPEASRLRPARVVWSEGEVVVQGYDRDSVGRVHLRRPVVR